MPVGDVVEQNHCWLLFKGWIFYMHSSWRFSWILHIHPFFSESRSAPRQQSSTLHLAQHKLYPAPCTQHSHHRISRNMALLFQNFLTSRRSICRWHGPLANQYQLLLKWDPHPFNAEGSTAMGTPLFCQWQGPGHPKMLLLLGRLVLGPQRPPSTQFQYHPLRNPTCNDLRQVNIHPYYSTNQKQHWEAHTGSAFIARWNFWRQVLTLPAASTQVDTQHQYCTIVTGWDLHHILHNVAP